MTVISLRARCASCGADELLSRIADGDGSCDLCESTFGGDESPLLFLRDVVRANVAYRLLIRSLRDLSAPGVDLLVLPEPLFLGLATGVPWQEGTELPSAVSAYVSLFPTQFGELDVVSPSDCSEETARSKTQAGRP